MFKKTTLLLSIVALSSSLFGLGVSEAAKPTVYTVKSGDTLWKIADNYDMDLDFLIDCNPRFSNPEMIKPGQKVNVPFSKDEWYKRYNRHNYWNKPVDQNEGNKNTGNQPGKNQPNKPVENKPVDKQPETTIPETTKPGNNNQPDRPTKPVEQPSVQPSNQSFEQQVVDLVNKERAKQGLKPLKVNEELSKVARLKSQDMRDKRYFSHDSPTYGSPFDMMNKFGITYRAAGENIAAGQSTPEQVMKDWMESPGHRQNIMDSQYTEIGVGLVEGGQYGNYWTQMFIRP